eukprot:8417719-Karenia_brevis.AAC.1
MTAAGDDEPVPRSRPLRATINDQQPDRGDCEVEWKHFHHDFPHLTVPVRPYRPGDVWGNFPPVLRSCFDGK